MSKFYKGENDMGYWKFKGIIENRHFKEGTFTQLGEDGTKIYEYTGKWVNGIRQDEEAEYREFWNDGETEKMLYEGSYKNGKMTGKGCATYFDESGLRKTEYKGEWLKGKFNGKGVKIIYVNGSQDTKSMVYDGEWVNGNFSGIGEVTEYENNIVKTVKKGIWNNGQLERELVSVETIPIIRRIRRNRPDFLRNVDLPRKKLSLPKPKEWSKWQELSYNLSKELINKDFRLLLSLLKDIEINDMDDLLEYTHEKHYNLYERLIELDLTQLDLENIDLLRDYNKKIAIKNILTAILAESMVSYEMEKMQLNENLTDCSNEEPLQGGEWSEIDPRTVIKTESGHCFTLDDIYEEEKINNTVNPNREVTLFKESMNKNPYTNSKWDDNFINSARTKRLTIQDTLKLSKLHERNPVQQLNVENIETNNFVDLINSNGYKYFLPSTIEWFKLKGNRRIDVINELENSNLSSQFPNLSIHSIGNEINQSYTYREFINILTTFINELQNNYRETGKYLIKQILEDIQNNGSHNQDI